jgi:hypothetical protein
MDLPLCHSRRAIEGRTDEALCVHPRVHVRDNLVTASLCRQCSFWREPAPASFRIEAPQYVGQRALSCIHLGNQTGLRPCPTCRGSVSVKVFACHHPRHGETTLAECFQCSDFEEKTCAHEVGFGDQSPNETS